MARGRLAYALAEHAGHRNDGLRSAGPPRSTMSDSAIVAKPSPTGSPLGAKVFSPVRSINYPVAIDPIKYIRVPLSFYYFEPDRNIVDKNGMPGKPSSPCGSIFGFYSHSLTLHFYSRLTALKQARVWDRRDQIMRWISVALTSRSQAVNMPISAATVAALLPPRHRRAIASA